MVCCRRRAPRPRPSGESPPRSPTRALQPAIGSRHAPIAGNVRPAVAHASFRGLHPESSLRPPTRREPAKMHPAAPSAIPANAGIHPHHSRTPVVAKKHPAPAEEFFGKNSYCARGARRRPSRPAASVTLPTFQRPMPRHPRGHCRGACTLSARSSTVVRESRS